ncbi:unnamed protein product [Ceratitis capitata]|uniref:(Mediterranean fruit fly) hypothetical protein n=1 Tax=Ceratitis capitata TaxID=7213 RepID=A0A811TZI5_CERCA|nr:unnamed protein product [Ceratitis capitata]
MAMKSSTRVIPKVPTCIYSYTHPYVLICVSTLTEKPCQSQRDNALDENERRQIDGNKLAGATNYSELGLSSPAFSNHDTAAISNYSNDSCFLIFEGKSIKLIQQTFTR